MQLEYLVHLLDKIRPKAAHLLVVEGDNGRTHMAATYNPKGRLILLNGGGCLTHRWAAIDTPYAEEIASAVGKALQPLAVDGFGPWYHAEYDRVFDLVTSFNPTTGARYRDLRFEVGARVRVDGAGKGEITGFRGAMLVVRLDEPCGHARSVVAHRNIVKPVLRLTTGEARAA